MSLKAEDVYGILNPKLKDIEVIAENIAKDRKEEMEIARDSARNRIYLGVQGDGDLIYIKSEVKYLGEDDLSILFQGEPIVFSTESDGIYHLKSIVKNFNTEDTDDSVRYYTRATHSDAYNKNNVIINLTETFGKGNEPNAGQMDVILSQFANSYFDGTKNIFKPSNFMGLVFKELAELRNAITTLGGNS